MSVVRRLWTTLLLLVTVVVGAATVYVLGHDDPVPFAGRTPGFSASPLETPASSAVAATTDRSTMRVVFLGDDYTAGVGTSSPKKRWTTIVSNDLGLDATVIASSGAGYLTRGADGRSYQDLVASAAAAKPDLVVVSGGRNDAGKPARLVRSAARAVFARLHAEVPDAVVLAIAPWWGDSPHPAKLAPVDAAVRSAVAAVGAQYLALDDPLVGHSDFMADDADPDDRGYQAIAASVEPALRDRLPR